MVKRSLPPDIEEEKSLDTEEMVGFECIDTLACESRTASKSQGRYAPSSLLWSASSRSSQRVETRQEDVSDESFKEEIRQSNSNSEDSECVSTSIEVSMTKGGSKSWMSSSRASRSSTQHFSVSTYGTSQGRGGTINKFLPSFFQIGRAASKYDITVHEDDNDVSTYWTETTPRQKGVSFYSSSSQSSSRSSSADDSSSGSSSEEEEDDDDDDDDETHSLASNSTISTRASEINKRWAAQVVFNESVLDCDRSEYDY